MILLRFYFHRNFVCANVYDVVSQTTKCHEFLTLYLGKLFCLFDFEYLCTTKKFRKFCHVQSNLAVWNFLVAQKSFLNGKFSLSVWRKRQLGHWKWFLNTNRSLLPSLTVLRYCGIWIRWNHVVKSSKIYKLIFYYFFSHEKQHKFLLHARFNALSKQFEIWNQLKDVVEISNLKVRIYWEGHKIVRNHHLTLVYSTYRQK